MTTESQQIALAHPRASNLIRTVRARLRAFERRLSGVELRAAIGVQAAKQARSDGWTGSRDDVRKFCAPCFTLTTGRTGTTTLANLGALSPYLESVHEPLPHLLTESYLCHRGDVADASFWDSVIAEARDWPIRDAYRHRKKWFEANNRLTFLATHIAERYQNSQYIILVRHPEDYAESAVARGYYERHPWDFARIRPRPTDPDHARWQDMSQLEKVGWLWRSTFEVAEELKTSIGPERVMTIRSEDLFANRGNVVANLFTFIAVKQPPASAVDDLLARPANAQKRFGAGSRRAEWDSMEHELFLRQVEPLMRQYGYQPQ